MLNNMMLTSCGAVLVMTTIMCYIVYCGYFATVATDLGHNHYAEEVIHSWKQFLPKWAKLPFNALVNVGYVIVGASWCAVTSVTYMRRSMLAEEAMLFYVFSFMACFYGPIQALRILTQLQGFAVLDQWYTFPFFMWVLIWGLYFCFGWNSRRALSLLFLSLTSYTWALSHHHGFEAGLGMHILVAIIGAYIAWQRHPKAKVVYPLFGALVSCAGFVVLKLLDHELANWHHIFTIISGHFISKVFDILQIHYVCKFFLAITLEANIDRKKKKE